MAKPAPLPELILSAKRSVWRMHDHADAGDKAFQQMRKAVLEAGNNTCRFCTAHSAHGMEVHHADDNHKNNDGSNLILSCPLCHQIFHIGLAGLKEGGEIIYCPELTQAEINQVALMIWMITETDQAKIADPEHAQMHIRLSTLAKTLDAALGGRRGSVMLRLKAYLEKTDFPPELLDKIKLTHLSPNLFSNILRELPDDDYARRGDLLGGIRLYPQITRFRERNKLWIDEQNAVLPLPAWYRILPVETVEDIVVKTNESLDKLRAESATPR